MDISNEDLFVALVVLISNQIDAAKKAGGTTRVGGDYTREALELIKKRRASVVELMRS